MKKRSSLLTLATALALSAFAFGCAHEAKPAQAATSPTGQVGITNAPAPAPNQGVSMSPDLKNVCGIADTGAAPKFGFDSALLNPTDRSELDQLGTCMTTGPLKGQNVELTGRADPRGEAEYNMNLGASRADAVKHYLAQLGVSSSRLTTTSRGALDAQGHDEATWAVDRRVDLSLAGR